ncbi:MAG: Crp/Fnr family transcriptional regulator [Bacteroidota bacterium]
MKKILIQKGEVLQRPGELDSKIFVVQAGLLRSFAVDPKGKEHLFMFAPEGWIIGDYSPPEQPAELFIDALEDSQIVILKKGSEDRSNFAKIRKRLYVLQQRILMLMSASAIQRYEHFTATYPDIINRVPQRMIASYLGITPEALSKVKGDRKRKQQNLNLD